MPQTTPLCRIAYIPHKKVIQISFPFEHDNFWVQAYLRQNDVLNKHTEQKETLSGQQLAASVIDLDFSYILNKLGAEFNARVNNTRGTADTDRIVVIKGVDKFDKDEVFAHLENIFGAIDKSKIQINEFSEQDMRKMKQEARMRQDLRTLHKKMAQREQTASQFTVAYDQLGKKAMPSPTSSASTSASSTPRNPSKGPA